MDFFALPDVPADQQSAASIDTRYEDINQAGRVLLTALPPAMGETVWRGCIAGSPHARAWSAQGIVPIMTRVVVANEPGPFSPVHRLAARGRYQLAHALDPHGAVERLVLGIWAEIDGRIGRVYGPPPPNAGGLARAGRVFAEHTFTRLFAPPEARRITAFEVAGEPRVPPARYDAPPLAAIATPPAAAAPLDPAPRLDPWTTALGLAHTDSNQHVNSMVYPRQFEEAALRRFAEHGRATAALASSWLEIGYRKPCFAGDQVRWLVQAFELEGGRLGAVGALVAARDATDDAAARAARPHCYVRMLFDAHEA